MTGLARPACLLLLCAMAVGTATAQTGTVSGRVEDDRGNPVSGANVVVTGTLFGTVTSEDGSFSFDHVRYGSYELKVIHAVYAQSVQALQVDAPRITIIVRLRNNDIDLVLAALDRTEPTRQDWTYQTGAGQTAAAVVADRILLLPNHQSSPFMSIQEGLPGLVRLQGPLTGKVYSEYYRGVQPAFAVSEAPVQVNTLPVHGLSSTTPVTLAGPDLFSQPGNSTGRSVSASYSTNGGGPSAFATYGGASGRMTYALNGAFQELLTDFSTGGSSTIDAQGRKAAVAGSGSYKIDATSMLVLASAVAAMNDVPVPEYAVSINSSVTSSHSVQYRKGLAGALRFVDIVTSAQFESARWAYKDTTFALPLTREDASRNRIAIEIASGGGTTVPYRFGIGGSYASSTSTRTSGVDTTALDISTLPNLDIYQSSLALIVAPGTEKVKTHLSVFSGVTSVRRDPGVDLGIVSETSVVRGTVAGSASASMPLNPTWSLQLAASHGQFAPQPELLFANGVLIQDGQTAGAAFTELPASTMQSLGRVNLSGSNRLANVLLSGVVIREHDAITLTPIEDRGTRQLRIDNTDRVIGSILARSLSSAMDIVFLEISGRLVFGRNTEYKEAPAALPQHALSSSLLIQSPGGGSYLRGTAVRYFGRTDVSDRLQEQETVGATVVGLGAGYQKRRMQIELGIENLFDRTYRHHLGSVAASETFRLAEQGRNASVILTYSF